MSVNAAMIKELRERSGAGMLDCKKALVRTDGDMEAAMEYLRKKGMATGGDSGKTAAEGICRIAREGDTKAAVIEINSQTDFAARSERFRAFAEAAARQALHSSAGTVEEFLEEAWEEDSAKTVREAFAELTAVIKEKLVIRRFARVEDEEGCLVTYLHGEGRIGVILDARFEGGREEVRTALRNVAMQIASMRPRYISRDQVPEDYMAHEKEILLARTLEENERLPEKARKPEAIVQRMVAGRLNKQLAEICLLDQVYVRAEDGKQTVGQYLAQVGKACGCRIVLREFVRFETGEGIEKKQDDFAREVMDQVKAAGKKTE